MKFGPVPLEQAEGAILAHSVRAGGKRIGKGTHLDASHLGALDAAGLTHVTVARLEPDDIEENAAATRLAQAIVPDPEGQGLRLSRAGTGRVNLFSIGPGVALIDADAVHALNSTDPMITLATVPPLKRVQADTMVATIKIIAYGVGQDALARASGVAHKAVAVAAPRVATATLIETRTDDQTPPDKGRRALKTRLDRLGVDLDRRLVVAHKAQALGQAIDQAAGQVVFVLTASATSDISDVGPEGLRQAGGQVAGFGMPVDPGNLLFFGQHRGRHVIGLPGCARSPALNGADWVMERLICGITVTPADIAAMGVGGLLKEIPTRPQPRRKIAPSSPEG